MAEGAGGKNWLPIESNPEVMNEYLLKLGWPADEYGCYDVMSTEDWALEMVPQPVVAVLMLFPIKEVTEAHREEEAKTIKESGQIVEPSLYYMKQTIGGPVKLAEDSFFDKFMKSTLTKTPDERAEELEKDDSIDEAHEVIAHEGQSAVVEDTWQHFIALVPKGGHLYELDGRKDTPINHGPTTPETVLSDAVRVIKQFMERDPSELRFTLVAIAKNPREE